ncbi:MAG: tRNA (adenosine(37)-N6)-threonylcarbamoyltransferase complex transferase subunit TsaD [Vampirovibrionales bacterium]|nr:tRNA (adenosine(37)-N6)-threonylcarbamoyltransferase complex transferase subunit TsaD [Vampirovibrionales bacterium]
MKILALESSCDDTGAAIIEDGRRVLANKVASQVQIHTPFGGVLPEAAAREHLLAVNAVVQAALDEAGLSLADMDAFAATIGPGLIGSLLIASSTAKALSLLTAKPFLGINHLYGHVASAYLESDLEPPFLCLLVSGGHTQLIHVKSFSDMQILGETLDDAVGEAYDKTARLLGLPFPGGPVLDKLAAQGDATRFELPIAKTQSPWDFSFSGLKTAVNRQWSGLLQAHPDWNPALDTDNNDSPFAQARADMAASFQRVAVKTLLDKTLACAKAHGLQQVSICGGVAANSALRQAFWGCEAVSATIPAFRFCTDNAAMIGASAFFNPITQDLGQDVFSRVLVRA